MNNEPVAYIDPYDLERLPHYDCYIGSQQLKNAIPLYTHPANLTDEEIDIALYVADITLDNLSDGDISMERIKAFVRAILQKAQEK